MLQFCGGRALSSFRLEKLSKEINHLNLPITRIASEYWHFCAVARTLPQSDLDVLRQILNETPTQQNSHQSGEFFLVLPRPGTISPWSTKATDIVHHCGLSAVERIERGIAYLFECESPLSVEDKARLASLLHDRMTETVFASFDDAAQLFRHYPPKPVQAIDLMEQGIAALKQANQAMGLALSADEIDYLADHFRQISRDPTDVELMMFAQANSEHCRHKIFNADWVVDGKPQQRSLFSMIRNTHQTHPQGTLVAYADNASVIEGADIDRFYPGDQHRYGYALEKTHVLMKVETHNHPTAISPFPGAATGVGGEIRDEGATGRGAKPKAGLCGFSVSNLRIPGYVQPWECDHAGAADSRCGGALPGHRHPEDDRRSR